MLLQIKVGIACARCGISCYPHTRCILCKEVYCYNCAIKLQTPAVLCWLCSLSNITNTDFFNLGE